MQNQLMWHTTLQIEEWKPHDHLIRFIKSFWQNSTPIYDLRNCSESGLRGNLTGNIQQTCNKHYSQGENLKAFSLRPGTRQRSSLSPQLFSIVFGIRAMAIREEKK